jgi:cobalt-zinc-cadmium efflux system outer membrane protein
MDKAAAVAAVTLAAAAALASSHSGQAFNAPRPITHGDFLRFNQSDSPDAAQPPLRPAIQPSTTSGGTAGSATAPAKKPSRLSGSEPAQPAAGTAPLSVTQALDDALLRSPRVSAVRAQLDISKAAYAAARQLPNPNFTYDNGFIAEQTRRVGTQTTYDPPWKIAFRLLAAKRQVQATKLDILHTLWLFRNDVRRTYTELVVAQESYQTLQDLADLSQRLLNVAEKRFAAGDVPELDVLKARLAFSQAQIDLEQGRRRTIRGRQQLNNIIGLQLESPLNVPRLPLMFNLKAEKSDLLPDFSRPVPRLQDLIDLALANRLELRLTKQQIALSQAQLYGAIGNIIPDPLLSTGQSASGNPPTGPKLFGFYVGMNFELPLLTYSQGEIARLKATIRQYYRQYHAQENQVIGEVSAAYNNLLAARERIRTYQEHVLRDSQEVADLARLSYEVGASDITATLAAQQANVQVRSQYLDAVTAYQQAFTDLEQAIGEPLQ